MPVYSVDRVEGRYHIFRDNKREPGEGFKTRNDAQEALEKKLKEDWKTRGGGGVASPFKGGGASAD